MQDSNYIKLIVNADVEEFQGTAICKRERKQNERSSMERRRAFLLNITRIESITACVRDKSTSEPRGVIDTDGNWKAPRMQLSKG